MPISNRLSAQFVDEDPFAAADKDFVEPQKKSPGTETLIRILLPVVMGDLKKERKRRLLIRVLTAVVLAAAVVVIGFSLGWWSLGISLPLAAGLWCCVGVWYLRPRECESCGENGCAIDVDEEE